MVPPPPVPPPSCRKILPERAGTVIVIGTPAEEDGGGKIALLKAGLFRDVDCAMMVHPSSKRMVTKGFIGLVRINLTFTGRSSHASAYPEEGINALDGVIQTFNGVNALRQQLGSDVRIHGIITDGGKAPNIIPERASATFYVRSAGGMRELNDYEGAVPRLCPWVQPWQRGVKSPSRRRKRSTPP